MLDHIWDPEMETILYAYPFDTPTKGRDDIVLWGFYSSLFVTRISHGDDRDYYQVSVTPFNGPEDEALYWAWWDNEKHEFHHGEMAEWSIAMAC